MDDATGPDGLPHVGKILLRVVVGHLRLFLGIQVVEVAEELVEAVVGRQHVVQVAKVVLAELAGRVPLILQQGGDRDDFVRHAYRRARNPDLREPGAEDALAGNERRAPGGARLLAVGIGEHHAFLGQPVDVWCLVAHQSVAVAAQVRDADVIAPDDEDVGFLARLCICHCGPPGHSQIASRPRTRTGQSQTAGERKSERRRRQQCKNAARTRHPSRLSNGGFMVADRVNSASACEAHGDTLDMSRASQREAFDGAYRWVKDRLVNRPVTTGASIDIRRPGRPLC